jgi:hypothetical protein
MATARTADRRTANRPLKSPLAVPSGSDTREHRLTPFSAIAFLASRTIPPPLPLSFLGFVARCLGFRGLVTVRVQVDHGGVTRSGGS